MPVHLRWRVGRPLIWLLAAVLLSSVPAAAQPAAADRSLAPLAAPVPRAVPCRQNVYPLLAHESLLADNPPEWHRPVTMASLGLSHDAAEADIPGLNTTTANSPRFRIDARNHWVMWRSSNEPWVASEPLVPMITGIGTLIDGYAEYERRMDAKINGVLDAGDLLAQNSYYQDTPSLPDIHAALDAHIANKTRMILPVYDWMDSQDIGYPQIYRIAGLIEVRLLDYALTMPDMLEGHLEFALLDEDKTCLSTAALYIPRTVRGAPAR